MKKAFILTAIAIYILSGLTLTIGRENWFPEFYNPDFLGAMAFISAFLIILPQLIFKSADKEKIGAVLNFQFAITSSLILSGLGGLGLYQLYRYGFEYDKLIHFSVPLIMTISFVHFLQQWRGMERKKALELTVVLVMAVGLLWEILEFLFDWYLGTQALGHYGFAITKDTIIDIITNAIGIIFGSIFILRKK